MKILLYINLFVSLFFGSLACHAGDVDKIGRSSGVSLSGGSIKVLVWNIYKAKNEDWKKEFLKLSEKKDLILVQESFNNSLILDTYKEISGLEFVMAYAYKIIFWGKTGVMTASKATAKNIYPLKSKNVEDFGTKKMALFTTYEIKNQAEELLVVNIHALVSVPLDKYKEHLKRIGDRIATHKGPMIVAGDFNSYKKRVPLFTSWYKALKLKKVKFSPDNRTKFGKTQPVIDFIFYKGLKLKASSSVRRKGSDHNPISAEFFLN